MYTPEKENGRRIFRDVVDIEAVKQMISKGKSWATIAIHYECAEDSLRRYCHNNGIYKRGPYSKK